MSQYFRSLRRPLFALPALIALAAACSSNEPRSFDRVAIAQAGIQGGSADSTDTGVVLILIDVGGGQMASCTGSLISRNVVLTARHCVAQVPAGGIDCTSTQYGSQYAASSFYVFNDQTYSQNSFAYTVKQVIVPSGNLLCGNDVALLVLNQNFNTTKAELLEPRLSQSTWGGEVYSAIGYGKTCPSCNDGGSARNRRNNLQVTCVGSSCGWGAQYITNKEWGGDDGVCGGDSGGPAFDGQGRVIGVASRGGESGGQCIQSMYERVDSYKDFITTNTITAANNAGIAPPAWTGGSTGGSGGAPDCATCENQAIVPGEACDTKWTACLNDTDCAALLDCWNKATTSDAQNKCIIDHWTGFQVYDAMMQCFCTPAACGSTSCTQECTKDSCGFQLGDAPCNTCFEGKCCDKGKACEDDNACRLLLTCISVCPANDQTCVNNCATKNSAGVTKYNAWINCLAASCTTECGFPSGTGGSAGAPGSGGAAGSPGTGGAPGSGGSAQGGAPGSGGSTPGQGGANPGQGGADPGQGGADPGQGGEDPGAGGEGGQEPGQPATTGDSGSDGGCTTTPNGSGSVPAWAALLAAAGMIASHRRR